MTHTHRTRDTRVAIGTTTHRHRDTHHHRHHQSTITQAENSSHPAQLSAQPHASSCTFSYTNFANSNFFFKKKTFVVLRPSVMVVYPFRSSFVFSPFGLSCFSCCNWHFLCPDGSTERARRESNQLIQASSQWEHSTNQTHTQKIPTQYTRTIDTTYTDMQSRCADARASRCSISANSVLVCGGTVDVRSLLLARVVQVFASCLMRHACHRLFGTLRLVFSSASIPINTMLTFSLSLSLYPT